jgi:hypothetical protein
VDVAGKLSKLVEAVIGITNIAAKNALMEQEGRNYSV